MCVSRELNAGFIEMSPTVRSGMATMDFTTKPLTCLATTYREISNSPALGQSASGCPREASQGCPKHKTSLVYIWYILAVNMTAGSVDFAGRKGKKAPRTQCTIVEDSRLVGGVPFAFAPHSLRLLPFSFLDLQTVTSPHILGRRDTD